MEKIAVKEIKIGEKKLPVTIYSINEDDVTNFSRVYVVASNEDGEIALIHNAKREIWGFPGGHPEKDEVLDESAKRECIEEIGYSIKDCEPKYALSNKLDDDKEEIQIICFAKIDGESREFVDENESVNKMKFVPIENIQEEIGNFEIWEEILKGYKEWLAGS